MVVAHLVEAPEVRGLNPIIGIFYPLITINWKDENKEKEAENGLFFNYLLLNFSGFLNTNVSPDRKPRMANYGLMDQIAALKWIQENIEQFGGDSNSVTLFGHNTGAACIHFLMQSPVVVAGKLDSFRIRWVYSNYSSNTYVHFTILYW